MQITKMNTALRRAAALPGDLLFAGAALLTAIAYGTQVNAAPSSGSGANVRGALDTNQQALDAVQNSTFTTQGAQDAAQTATDTVLYAAGFLGIVIALIGLWMVFKHNKEGDRAQGSAAGGWIVIAIGGLVTIVSIVAAVVPNLAVGV